MFYQTFIANLMCKKIGPISAILHVDYVLRDNLSTFYFIKCQRAFNELYMYAIF